MWKITKGTTARKQTKAARRKNSSSVVKDNAAASNEPINFRERIIMAISEIRACVTFSLDNNGDILMLIEIIFD